MLRDPRVLLMDIEQAGADIERYTEGATRSDYLEDGMMQAAVERKFEIIGEAMNRLHRSHPALAGRIPLMRRIVDFRNLLSHGYDEVESERVWTYAESDLPQLREVVQALLAELGPPEE